jgi:hypothetical protein
MASIASKEVIAGIAGLVYAAIYGFWTMLATGGGHGNFIWIGLFIFVEFLGLYFPIMAVLAMNLRSRMTKIVFGSLILFNLVASVIMILGWITEAGEDGRPSDFSRQMEISGLGVILFCGAFHLLPTAFFGFLLIRSFLFGQALAEPNEMIILDLEKRG